MWLNHYRIFLIYSRSCFFWNRTPRLIFATPPMVRLTLLGLNRVSPEIIESGYMSGCNNWQLMTRVLIPSAKQDIMIGVNQVIMQCLAMVVIASFIGAPGLGYKVLIMLNNLRIGKALELGVWKKRLKELYC